MGNSLLRCLPIFRRELAFLGSGTGSELFGCVAI